MNKKIINASVLLLSLSTLGSYATVEKKIVLQENPVEQIVQDEALYQELKSQYKFAKKKRAKKRKKLGIKKKKKNKGNGLFSCIGTGISWIAKSVTCAASAVLGTYLGFHIIGQIPRLFSR